MLFSFAMTKTYSKVPHNCNTSKKGIFPLFPLKYTKLPENYKKSILFYFETIMRPNKSSCLRPEWSFLPQLVTKKKRQHETKPWRSRFCKSDAARWESIKQLQGHISRQHSLHKKGDFSDLEPPINNMLTFKFKLLSEKGIFPLFPLF